MAFLQRFKKSNETASHRRNENGIALFMVLASLTILAMLVTEFTYVAQVNSRMAFDSLDQVKAHYLAKSGLKLSLIRIRAYQNLKALAANAGAAGAAGGMIPKGILEKIWSFPFMYPIPTNLPGMTTSEKDQIQKFTKSASIDGHFSAKIDSESSKFNLNSLLAPFATLPSPSPSSGTTGASGGSGQAGAPPNPNPNPSPTASFNPEDARSSLATYLTQLLNSKLETDDDFADTYRDLKTDELFDNILTWVDPAYPRRTAEPAGFRPKGGPFYSLSELRLIDPIDDQLYDLLAPNLTVSAVPGLNVNTVKEMTLKAFFPQMTAEEITEFYKFRDSTEQDNSFRNEDGFFNYLKGNVAAFRGSDNAIDQLRNDLRRRNIQIVTDETHFKVTVLATVNQAIRLIEAHVMIEPPRKTGTTGSGIASSSGSPPGTPPLPQSAPTDSGLRITSMRIL
ncbi:MAG: hypothetical protein RJB38_222 [Pseudomonadota bacterium]|jgi:type II secretory pathway component PulK